MTTVDITPHSIDMCGEDDFDVRPDSGDKQEFNKTVYDIRIQRQILAYQQKYNPKFGLICYKWSDDQYKYLCVIRRCSISLSCILAGFYPIRSQDYIRKLLKNMTTRELNMLPWSSFDDLWSFAYTNDRMTKKFGSYNTDEFSKLHQDGSAKFQCLKEVDPSTNKSILDTILDGLRDKNGVLQAYHRYPQIEFPKGNRISSDSTPVECAKREFCEEINMDKSRIGHVTEFGYLEIFKGMNHRLYCIIYYIMYATKSIVDSVINAHNIRYTEDLASNYEILSPVWLSLDEFKEMTRTYTNRNRRVEILELLDWYLLRKYENKR